MSDKKLTAYPYSYCFNGKVKTLLWLGSEEDDGDKFLTFDDGPLYVAESDNAPIVELNGIDFNVSWNERAEIDFDQFWLELDGLASFSKSTNYDLILTGWNFIEDILRTYSLTDLRKRLDNITDNDAYQKIFSSSNIEVFQSQSEDYEPKWSQDEVTSIVADLRYVWEGVEKKINLLW